MDEIDVASLTGGHVLRINVNEGDSVRAGDTLAVLDRGEVTADLAAQAAQAERAAAQWRDLRSGPRPEEIQAARAALDAAKAQADLAETELARFEALYKDQMVSAAERDRARATRDAAAAQKKAAEEQLRLLERGYRRQQIAAAEKAAEAARAQVSASKSRVNELFLTAPVSGVVLLKNFRLGELVSSGVPVLTLGNPDSLWLRVYIATPLMGRVRLGAPAEIHVIGLSRTFKGRVVEISTKAEFTPRAALTEEEQANQVFGVKIMLEPTAGILKAGLPAEARIDTARV